MPAHRMRGRAAGRRRASRGDAGELAPMLAELGDAAFNHADWMWEPKLDGYRVLAFIDGEAASSCARGAASTWPPTFRRLCAELRAAGACSDDPRRRDRRVRRRAAGRRSTRCRTAARKPSVRCSSASTCCTSPASTCARRRTRDRRRYLAQCLLPSPLVQLVHAADDGVALHAAALASGFEGVVGKRKDSRYEAGKRSASWLKVKPTHSADFVIGGYTQGKGARAPLGALLVGYWDGGKLRYASHVGSGFDDSTLRRCEARSSRCSARPIRSPRSRS